MNLHLICFPELVEAGLVEIKCQGSLKLGLLLFA